MGATLAYMVGLGIFAAWWLSRQGLAAKPWLEEGAGDFQGAAAASLPAAKVGLGAFLAVAGLLFTLLISAYVMSGDANVAQLNFAGWRPAPMPRLLWVNTGLLVLSSAALHAGQVAARRGAMASVRAAALAGGVTATAFLAGQLAAWAQLDAAGYFSATNSASVFFCLLTGAHGLHVVGGLAALCGTGLSLWSASAVTEKTRLNVELCAIYWHFLLLVWLALFGLLLVNPGGFCFSG